MKKIVLALTVLLLFTPATGQLVSLPIGEFNLLPSDVVLPILFIVWLWDKWRHDRQVRLGPIGKSVLILIGAMLLSYALNWFRFDAKEMLLSGFHLARVVMYMLSFFVAYDLLARDETEKTRRWLLVGLIGAMALIVILGLLQFWLYPSLLETPFHHEGWDPHINRLFSTWLDPNFVGGYLSFALGVTLALGLYFFKEKNWRWFVVLTLIALLGIAAVALTFSRSGYLALMAMLGILALLKSRKLLLIAVLVIALGLGFSPRAQERVGSAWESGKALFGMSEAELDPTAQLRVDSWNNAWAIIRDYPVLGAGYNRYPYEIQARELSTTDHAIGGSDSSLLTLWATTGLLGLLAAVGVMVASAIVGFKAIYKKKDLQSYLSAGLLAGLTGLMVSTIFVNGLFYALIMVPMWVGVVFLEQIK